MTAPLAIVSGASRGIGAAIALRLYREGWQLSLGMRTPSMPPWADPERCHLYPYDASVGREADWVADALARFGRVDAVVASAGIMLPGNVIDAPEEDLDRMLDINVKAPRRLVRAAFPALKASGRGRVVILASLSGKRVKSANAGMYSVSKFGAVALAHGIRQAGYEHGVRATAVCPSFVDTDMARAITDRRSDAMTDPDELAAIVSMLISLSNTASVAEFHVNCQLEEVY
ncbi:SDR family NAD(P)-dependent oxidoreductase [Aureimonas altamirensis]|uniref:SDR family NAD(P)-dependent oxidoreductase n=1 Tax=Aureimonas altamirensis TaxID=370622 RepID=UPI001E2E1FA5|nr:SDR family NAD(P)-dependent oxidoreductase [Aureimonas altamirensis]UHD43878.1 SDR family NAD(P)-dependent oxidoreductase [Aureimonas altamirensis]